MYRTVEKLFVMDKEFDLAMVHYIRNAIKNFLEQNRDISINGLPIETASVVEDNPKAKTLDEYIKNIVM